MSDLLKGVRVLEFAVLLNGDSLGMLLGDLGADVIKIEGLGVGDYLRDMLGQIVPRHSPAHLQVNKNKRSLSLDLKSESGKDIFWKLMATADVFIDGFAGSVADRLGIGFDEQKKHFPRIIYCQHTGFGRFGPYSEIPTHGQMMNAGAAAVTLNADDDGFVRATQNNELMWGTSIGGDGTAAGAIHAAFHVAAALWKREKTGEGCYLDVSATDAVISQAWIGAIYGLNQHRLTNRNDLRGVDSEAQTGARYQYYETSDKKFILFCGIEPKFWNRFCILVERQDLIGPELEAAVVDFARDKIELRHELQEIFLSRPQTEWVDLAIQNRLPIGPAHQGVLSLQTDRHLNSRGIFFDGDHPIAGPFTYVGEPVIVDHEVYQLRRHAPTLGEHNFEILFELGYSVDQITELIEAEIIS